ncbi:B3 domain-containing protein REM9-like [Asparagus officinalis]|uniref:B3 domain-containing protein REM9-like n=1 Tax=Asparagus officinalis TaxID=4686 RepID=UPI00098E8085|nr:B3 domain-containing protein REM9-like [Asparagus officinalis]
MVFDFRAYDLSSVRGGLPHRRRLLLERRRGPEKRRAAGADPRYVVVKEEELDDDANERPEEAPDSRSSGGRATVPHVCFEAKMTFYNLTKPYMYFPIGVIRQCSELSHLKEITLKDPELRLWETQIFHRKTPPASGSGTHIARGWLEFAQANKLNIGDRCVFELVPRGKKMTMNVQIIRKL